MKMFTATEAHQMAKAQEWETAGLDSILSSIRDAASSGKYAIMLGTHKVNEFARTELIDAGYGISEDTKNVYTISWE